VINLGDVDLAILALVLFFALLLLMISQVQIIKDLALSKETVQLTMQHDDRGTEIVSFLKSGEKDRLTIYILGGLAADDYETYLKDDLEKIEERVEGMGPAHELIVSGESLAYYTGKATETPVYTQVSSQECGITSLPEGDIKLRWPSSGKRITSGFGYRELGGGCDCHGGIDVGGDNLDVYAAADGVVVDIYPNPDEGQTSCKEVDNCLKSQLDPSEKEVCKCNHGYGNRIEIEHEFEGIKYRTYYYHLKTISSGIKRGSRVKVGDVIAKSGNTGFSEAAHLHFELREYPYKADDANSINPCDLFETKDWSGNCVHEFPDVCKTFKVYGAYIPVPGAQSNNIKTEVSLRVW
jgi:hypothetical protein